MSIRPKTIGEAIAVWAALALFAVAAEQPGQASQASQASGVRVWEDTMTIPTYEVGPPDRNPMFYTHESYQGAQKRIYPYAVQDNLTHERRDKAYKALHLENEYLAIIVLPEMGGRLFAATDKTNGYDFFYRQHVVKPALIGMLGAWISGGVEWCAFHHHRNTTYMPVDYTLAENADGSKTIWFGETERRHRMKWLIGLTLHPGKSYLETSVKFINRTAEPHSILYWANVAVHVNDDYQVIFPPSVQVATYHSKIDFTHWPISQGKYRGHDYTGLDVSWWKNSSESNSFFAWNLQEDFMGGYDHGRQTGVVHVGNHHVVCGAKLWEWGTGPFGKAWDKILTDEDGPYAELMVGAFSDNQPDYSWIKPYEVKSFKQYWYPIRDTGGFKNANLDAAVNLEVKDAPTDAAQGRTALVAFHATSPRQSAKAVLRSGDRVLLAETVAIGPDKPFRREVRLPDGIKATDLRASLAVDGKELISYQPVDRAPVKDLPKTVQPPPKPQDVKTIEELYLTGLRVEQIHNPSVDPADYYREALSRDPGDSRSNTAMGIHYNKRGMYAEAEKHLRAAIERLSAEYTRPSNTEAYYQLGLALRAQGKEAEAYDAFYRASWDFAFRAPAYYQLAELAARRGELAKALEHVEDSLAANAINAKGLCLRAAVLRKLGRLDEAAASARRALAGDPLDFWAIYELALIDDAAGRSSNRRAELARKMRGEVQAYLELAADYMGPGWLDEPIALLETALKEEVSYPLVHYWLGALYEQKKNPQQAKAFRELAAKASPDFGFPFRMEEAAVLEAAIAANPQDARAFYYLGNLWFDLQPERAIEYWEKSAALDASFPTVHRNLGWAYYRASSDIAKAIASYERAVACEAPDARLFFELDSLYEFANAAPERRLAALEKNHAIAVQRQDSLMREIMVLVLNGRLEQAIEYLAAHRFHAREGSEGIRDVYVDAHLLRGLELLGAGDARKAAEHFQKAGEFPENLAVGRSRNDPRAAQIAFHTGQAQEALGLADEAKKSYARALDQQGTSQWPEARFYQAQAALKLGKPDEAQKIFAELAAAGASRIKEDASTDFFAKFGEQETKKTRAALGHFLIGLAAIGEGRTDEARSELEQAVKMNLSHVWARYWLAELK